MAKLNLFWFRRDLRLDDNAGLYYALKAGEPVLPVFIFDTEILSRLGDKHDRRVDFIHRTVIALDAELQKHGSALKVLHGEPEAVFKKLVKEYDVSAVYTNHDYEPEAIRRDKAVAALLKSHDIAFHTYKDQCIFEKDEVTKDDGKPYTVFTPYSRKWKAALTDFYVKPYPCKMYYRHFYKTGAFAIPSLGALGFNNTDADFPPARVNSELVKHYHQTRDIPGVKGTSHLGLHLRFGTVSIRALVRKAQELNETWLNELIWRDFFMMILSHFPHVEKHAFKKAYDHIKWRYAEKEFEKWCKGETGFPIVDAGMRELNATGFMHNRVRMITASFLVKDLLIDWRWGEAYFAEKLLDYELSSNNGNWQWAAGTGCDAAPYFRIFNPESQAKKFDPQQAYIKKWVPEYGTPGYVKPMVDHGEARNRTLQAYKRALAEGSGQASLF